MYCNWKENIKEEELEKICNLIKNGELVVFPTETVYGIGANALDEIAVKRIFEAKGRPSDNPLIIHLASKDQIEDVAKEITDVERKLIEVFMPGPFTLILKRREIVPDIVTAGLDTVAVRIPENKIAQMIIKNSNVPVAAPSANVSGKPSGTNIEDIKNELENKVSAIVDGGETKIGLESTVVKVVNEVPVILRPGRITPEDIKNVVGNVQIDKNVFEKIEKNEKVESPGMKYRHYAPTTKCKLINYGDEKKQIEIINKLVNEYNNNAVVLGFTEHKDIIKIKKDRYIDIGKKQDFEEIAKRIYSALRKADLMRADIILIEGLPKEGIGIAIMNRLLRTCEYDCLE